ncbi:hypothetical protein BOTBODRAFT_618452 [Botryobasidium botryosum FD-172 SS1]|uniref:RING-type E3 ubiquitin transferase n=1 Tax=Botryobasidium botryosum (strain FD-172 SS1) TaxID=930990 RepID=A0A067N0N6_BOTB1|nr:hypothetical protein BOTBODRAFT_618452 [Botryobasidium botryosum FD-172 SS1]
MATAAPPSERSPTPSSLPSLYHSAENLADAPSGSGSEDSEVTTTDGSHLHSLDDLPTSSLPRSAISLGVEPPTPTVAPVNGAPGPGQPRARPRLSLFDNLLRLFGIGDPARRQTLSFVWPVAFGFAQVITIIILTALSGHQPSPTQPDISQWKACSKPLGAWSAVWAIRVALGICLAFWERERRRRSAAVADAEQAPAAAPDTNHTLGTNLPSRAQTHTAPANNAGATAHVSTGESAFSQRTFHRLSALATLISLTHFITTNILVYSSVSSCRLSSPLLWWLSFTILCIGYIAIAETLIVAIFILIVGPILYIVVNIILLCMGRRPITYGTLTGATPYPINPDIPKMPKRMVDRIPLVYYIPAREEEEPVQRPAEAHLREEHSYPPTSTSATAPPAASSSTPAPKPRRRGRFAFLRPKRKAGASADGPSGSSEVEKADSRRSLEDQYEPVEFPFVRLEGNRATCSICLEDYDEPRKKGAPHVEGEEDPGPTPLRHLPCNHVFHQTCIDPWLLDVSGRCPTCQRKVEFSPTRRSGGAFWRRGPRERSRPRDGAVIV